MVPTSIMSYKGDVDISKDMWASIDQSIFVMVKVEMHIGLSKGTRMDGSKAHSKVLPQEVIKHIADASERYMMIGERIDGGNGEVTVQPRLPSQVGSRDRSASLNHHPIEAPRHEQGWVDGP